MIEKTLNDSIGENVFVIFSNKDKTVVSKHFGLLLFSNLIEGSYLVGHFPTDCIIFTKDSVTEISYDEDDYLIIQIVN